MMKQKMAIAMFTTVLILSLVACNSNNDSIQVKENNMTEGTESFSEEESNLQEENLNGDTGMPSNGFSTEYTIENVKDGYFIASKLDGALYGLLDSRGTEVLTVEYDNIFFPDSQKANAVIVLLEGKYGVYSYDGKEILAPEYEKISNTGRYSKSYLVQKDGKQSIVGLDGKIIRELTGSYDKLIGDSFLTICQGTNALERFYTDVYNLNEEKVFSDGDLNKRAGTAFEIENAENIIGVYYPGNDSNDSKIVVMDKNWKEVLSYTFAYDDFYEYENIFSYVIDDEEQCISLYYPREVYGNYHVFYNLDTKEIGKNNYNEFIYASDETIFAQYIDTDSHTYRIDIMDIYGNIESSIESIQAQNIPILEGNEMILSQTGETYRIYNKEGNQVTEDRYLSAELDGNVAIIQNLNGEYGLLGNTGDMLIEFGNMGDESYNGQEWKDTYSFDDTFCIVTENGSENSVWLFSD